MKTIAILFFAIITAISNSFGQTSEIRDTLFTTDEHIKVSAQIGTITVPENRKHTGSRPIAIRFVRLKSLVPNPKSPLIYLEGGGSPCTWQAEDPGMLANWIPYLQVSDVILIDQRGTADQDLLYIWMDSYPENFMITEKDAGDHWKKMAATALPIFEKKGIDVTGYTIEQNAEDIHAVTEALGIKRFSILGFSFGTQVGLQLIDQYGNQIDAAVLAGADGLDHSFNYPSYLDQQVRAIASMVANDVELKKQIPDFCQLLLRVMKKLKENPVEANVKNPLTGEPMKVKVGPFGLALVLRLDIDDVNDIPVLPRLLYGIEENDLSVLEWFVQKRIVFAFAIPGNGLTQGIAPGASPERMARIEKEASESIFDNVVNFPFYQVKPTWPLPVNEPKTTSVTKPAVRTLFLSGDLDCRTPAGQVEEIRKNFSNNTHLIVTNAGHEQVLTNDEVIKAIVHFLKGNDVSKMKPANAAIHFVPLTGKSDLHPATE